MERPNRARPEAGWADVVIALTSSDLRARYGRGRFRLIKWLLDPYALVGIYLLLVVTLLDRDTEAAGLSLACAIVPFQIVTMTVVNAMGAVDLRASILLNMAFRRNLLPVSTALTEGIAFGASASLLALMMVIYSVPLTVAILWLPLIVAVNFLLAIACAFPATLFGVWFVDLRPFAVSFMRALFFLAPGLIPLSQIHGSAQDLVRLNPLSGLFEAYRDALLYGHAPAAWELLVPIGFSLALLAIFVPVYGREQRHFAKLL